MRAYALSLRTDAGASLLRSTPNRQTSSVARKITQAQNARAQKQAKPGHPQGDEGDDTLSAEGYENRLDVCPASALPTAPDLAFFRRAATATTS